MPKPDLPIKQIGYFYVMKNSIAQAPLERRDEGITYVQKLPNSQPLLCFDPLHIIYG